MGRKLYDRQKERVPVLRGAELATLKQIVRADTTFDITTKSINNLSDVYSSMSPSNNEVLTYDTTNGWQSEITQFPSVSKSGATQVAAGAAEGEFWYTSGHATLPDNVLMLGV